MMSVVIYEVTHLDYGQGDERTGFWLQRCTIADDRGVGIANGAVIDRKPLAKFQGNGHIEDALEAKMVNDAIKSHKLRLFAPGWTIPDVAKEILR